ncbi:MAG: hypothetical protein ABW185_09085 [Sedimenticola sp.]
MDVQQAIQMLESMDSDPSDNEQDTSNNAVPVDTIVTAVPIEDELSDSTAGITTDFVTMDSDNEQDTSNNAVPVDTIVTAVPIEDEISDSTGTTTDFVTIHVYEASVHGTDVPPDGSIEFRVDPRGNLVNVHPSNVTRNIEESSQSSEQQTDDISPLLTDDVITDESTGDSMDNADTEDAEDSLQRGSRKRKKNPKEWKANIRKRRRQSGQEYIDSLGKSRRSREIRTTKDCNGACRFRCSQRITTTERSDTFNRFWSLNDDEKLSFYLNTTERCRKERIRTKAATSRKVYTYKYYVTKGSQKVRVCKEYYLHTLDISSKRIFKCYEKADKDKFGDNRGKHRKKFIPEEARQVIKDHIASFPRIPSHYCRATTKREYLEADLSVNKMYNLYIERCEERHIVPLKKHIYRYIFNTEYNIGFHVPKKDRCDM